MSNKIKPYGRYHYAVAYKIDNKSHKDDKLKHYVRGVKFVVSNPNENGSRLRSLDFKAKKDGEFYSKCYNLVKETEDGDYIPNLETMDYKNLEGYDPNLAPVKIAFKALKKINEVRKLRKKNFNIKYYGDDKDILSINSKRKKVKKDIIEEDNKPKKRVLKSNNDEGDDDFELEDEPEFHYTPKKNSEKKEEIVEESEETKEEIVMATLDTPDVKDSLQKGQYVDSTVINWQIFKLRRTLPDDMYMFLSDVANTANFIKGGNKSAKEYKSLFGNFNKVNHGQFKYLIFPCQIRRASYQHWIIYVFNTHKNYLKIVDPCWYKKQNPLQAYKSYTNAMIRLLNNNGYNLDDSRVDYYEDIPEQHDSWRCGLFCIKNLRCVHDRDFTFDYQPALLERLRVNLLNELGGYDGEYFDPKNKENAVKNDNDKAIVIDDKSEKKTSKKSSAKNKKEKGKSDFIDGLSKDDIDSLNEGKWVSDFVIDYYIKNSFNIRGPLKYAFYTTVIRDILAQKDDNVVIFNKWFKGNYHDCTMYLMPVRIQQSHWILYVFNKNHGVLSIFDPDYSNHSEDTYKQYTKAIRKFFDDVISAKEKKSSKAITNVVIRNDITRQEDFSSCGRHLMMNMECIRTGLTNNYNSEMLNNFIDRLKRQIKSPGKSIYNNTSAKEAKKEPQVSAAASSMMSRLFGKKSIRSAAASNMTKSKYQRKKK